MKEWVIYALIAALFIAVLDVISLDLIKRMNYTNYIIIANIIIFIATMIYLNISNYKVEKPNLKDM